MKKSKLLQKYCAGNTTFYIIKLLSFNIFFLYKIFMHILIWFIKHTRMVYTHGHQHICNTLLKREKIRRGQKLPAVKKQNLLWTCVQPHPGHTPRPPSIRHGCGDHIAAPMLPRHELTHPIPIYKL